MSWFDVDSAFAEMEALSRQVDAMVGQGGVKSFSEEGDQLVFRADLPGTTREDVEVNLENGVLTIDAKRKDDGFDGKTARHRERRAYELHRSFTLPDTVDPDGIQAGLEDGVLTVRLRQQPAPTPRRISVA